MPKNLLYPVAIFLLLLLVLHGILIILGNGAYGGADNVAHFRIARYAFEYPNLFFDHWGKPVFTLLMAPFALLGFKATQLVNVVAGLAAIALTVDIARLASMKINPVFLFFTAFAPMYFLLMESCLTEILLSLFLVMSVWLFLKEKYIALAILLSFLPFVRTESIVVLPLFALAFLFKRKFICLPLMLTGSVLYSFAGYVVYHDLLWVVHQMPYSTGASVYGHGELLHFVKSAGEIIGKPFALFLVLGLIIWAWQVFRKPDLKENRFWLFILVAGSWGLYFAAHSWVWYKGTGGSLGLIRVMAGVIPLAAITTLPGLNWLSDKLKYPALQLLMVGAIAGLQAIIPFRQHPLPFQWEKPQQLMAEAASFVKASHPQKVYYFDPFLIHFMEMDPYDQQLNNWGIADKAMPSNSMITGDLLVWDAHFGPNEGGVSQEVLSADPHLQLEKSFLPAENFKVLGGYDYAIYVFRKVDTKKSSEPAEMIQKERLFNPGEGLPVVESDSLFSLRMDDQMEFSPAIKFPVSEIKATDFMELSATVRFLPEEVLPEDAVLLVLSIEHDGKTLSYNKADMVTGESPDEWRELTLPLRISSRFPGDAVMNLYVWNKNKKKLLVEKITLTGKGY